MSVGALTAWPDLPGKGNHPYATYVNPHLARLLAQLELDKVFVRGEGCYLYDRHGRRYLDFLAQYGALPFGYNHPDVWRAVEGVRQRREPSFVQPSYLDAAGELARRLVQIAPAGMQYVTFANSGAEAVEAAIKLCKSTTGRTKILAAANGFHGKTLAALSATDKKKYQEGFGAPVAGYSYVPFGDLGALDEALSARSSAAFLVEPIQGEGGIVEAPPGYLAQAREICRSTGTLMVVDEIQTGLGRTGVLFACESEGVTPDVITLAKALGGGLVPLGACLCTEEAYNDDFALKHTSTFAGNTLAARIGLATLELLERDDRLLVRQVAENGAWLKDRLLALKDEYPHLIDTVRGRGYMLGIRFGLSRHNWGTGLLGCLGETEVLTSLAVSHMLNLGGVRLGYTLNQGGVLRVEPPLVAGKADGELFLHAFEKTLRALDTGDGARFTAHITGVSREKLTQTSGRSAPARRFAVSGDAGRFAFLLHPLKVRNYADVDPGLEVLSDRQILRLASCVADNFDPFVIGEAQVVSPTGATAYGEFVIVPRTARELREMPHRNALSEIRTAVRIARDRGARIVGLGAYTSIVSQGGLYLKGDSVPPLTTGNSYTAFASREAIRSALEGLGRQPGASRAAVVGASGSIGRALSLLLAQEMGHLVLIGNPDHPELSLKRLTEVTADILHVVREARDRGQTVAEDSVGGWLLSEWGEEPLPRTKSERVALARKILASEGRLAASCDLWRSLEDSDVVVTATNAVTELIRPEGLKPGAVLCDVSRPANAGRQVRRERPDVSVVEGGIVHLPCGSRLNFTIDLEPGLVYACMAETMILALEHHYRDTGLGLDLDLGTVLEMGRLARRHGFHVHSAPTCFRPTVPSARAGVEVGVRASLSSIK